MATGSGVAGGDCGTCGFWNWPVAVGWTCILGTDCVEVDGMGGGGAGGGGGLAVVAGTGGRVVVILTKTDVGAVTYTGLVATVVDGAGGTSRICAVLTGLTLPVPWDAGVAWGGLSPCSSSFLSSRMSIRRLTAAILCAVSASFEV